MANRQYVLKLLLALFMPLGMLAGAAILRINRSNTALSAIKVLGGEVEILRLPNPRFPILSSRYYVVTLPLSNRRIDSYSDSALEALSRIEGIAEVRLNGRLVDDLNNPDTLDSEKVRSVLPKAAVMVRIH
jgi:hypothetical protein